MEKLHSVPGGMELLEWSPCDHYTEELQHRRLSVYKVCGWIRSGSVCKCKEQKPSCGCHHPCDIGGNILFFLQKVEIFAKLLRGLLFVLDDEQQRLAQRKVPQVVSQQQADVVYFDIGGALFSCNPVFTFIGIVQEAGMCIFQFGASGLCLAMFHFHRHTMEQSDLLTILHDGPFSTHNLLLLMGSGSCR